MADVRRDGGADQLSDQSTAELVQRAAEQISQLVRNELRLAQAELAEKGKRAGIGAGMFGGAGAIALYGGGALVAAAVLALAYAMPDWLAALIVGVVLLAVAGGLVLAGRKQVRQASPPVPERAVDSVKADIETVTEAVRERGTR